MSCDLFAVAARFPLEPLTILIVLSLVGKPTYGFISSKILETSLRDIKPSHPKIALNG